ncbi:hypothetical protein ACH5RR_031272 [Cinchona calisaya]|uniref:Uncharacterized protein n=1 Tax=Cinchona calisaya TaxID=153742 RepID=A0ABD2YI69_9GENT
MEFQEKKLNVFAEFIFRRSKELDLMRESIKEWLKQDEEEQAYDLFEDKGVKDLELKKKELSLIQENVKVMDEKLNVQQKLIHGLSEKIEFEREQFQTTGKAIDGRFREICWKERQINLIKIHTASRLAKLDKRDENLERREKEIELKEVVLASRNEEVIAKERQLNLIKIHTDSRLAKLDKREENLERREKEIELRKLFWLLGRRSL